MLVDIKNKPTSFLFSRRIYVHVILPVFLSFYHHRKNLLYCCTVLLIYQNSYIYIKLTSNAHWRDKNNSLTPRGAVYVKFVDIVRRVWIAILFFIIYSQVIYRLKWLWPLDLCTSMFPYKRGPSILYFTFHPPHTYCTRQTRFRALLKFKKKNSYI